MSCLYLDGDAGDNMRRRREPTPTPRHAYMPAAGKAEPGRGLAGTPYPITRCALWLCPDRHALLCVWRSVRWHACEQLSTAWSLATGTWEPRAPMPFESEAPTCALMEATGIVYCAEGDTGSGFASYNIATDTWTPLAADPGGRSLRLCIGCLQRQGVCCGRHHCLQQRGTGI